MLVFRVFYDTMLDMGDEKHQGGNTNEIQRNNIVVPVPVYVF